MIIEVKAKDIKFGDVIICEDEPDMFVRKIEKSSDPEERIKFTGEELPQQNPCTVYFYDFEDVWVKRA